MKEVTVSAKTLDDAITEALIQLGITSDQLDYDVIEKGSAGFFGIGSKQAVIRARKKAVKEEFEKTIEEIKDIIKEEPKKEVKKEAKKEFKKEVKKEPKKEFKKEPKKEVHAEAPSEPKKESVKEPVKEVEKENAKERAVELCEVKEETKAACEKFLKDVLDTMNMEVVITTSIDEDGALCINMDGKNMGILIGKRGQTLDSLQYLVNRVANKQQDGYVRVKLDTENYRKRRKDTLENLAKNIAYKVKRTKKSISLEPMNPYERRIIHSALQADKYVNTHSEGEEPYRRVVVTLARR